VPFQRSYSLLSDMTSWASREEGDRYRPARQRGTADGWPTEIGIVGMRALHALGRAVDPHNPCRNNKEKLKAKNGECP
jgi:hypothetical protein